MSIDVDAGGLFESNYSYNYDDNYEYKDDPEHVDASGVAIPLLYSAVLVTGLLGNGLLLTALFRKRRSWRITDTFVLHQCVADVLLLLTLPLWAAEAAQRHGWSFGLIPCKISTALFYVNFYCGIFLLVCVVLDRYRSVRRAARCFSESRTAWVTCLCVCLCSVGLAVPRGIFTATADVPGRDRMLCVESYSASSTVGQLLTRLLHHVLGFLLPAAILIVCCSCVVLRLRSSSRESQKQRASVVVLFSTAAFLLFWMPHNIALFLDTVRSRYEESENSLKTALMVTSVFGCIHTCVRPLLYLCLSANFRAWALALLKRAPVEHAGSLWGLGVGEDEVREQSPMGEEQERMKDGNHQMQSSHC